MNKSHALFNLGDEKEALNYIDKALEVDPHNENVLELKKRLLESVR